MKRLIEELKQRGADKYFHEMGLELETLFQAPDLEQNPYREHLWELRRNEEYIIVNAIPPKELQDHLFWEEWFIHEQKVHHHILSLWRPPRFDEIFQAPERDEIHPPQSFGRRWYVVNDVDLRPLLMRRS